MKKIWQIAPSPPLDFIKSLFPLRPLLGVVLWNRGFRSAQGVKDFLNNELDPSLTLNFSDDNSLTFYNPFLFRDMKKAVDLIISHIKKENRIMVYGDYDADGVTASSVLAEALNTMQASTEVYLPDRVSEGYGLNKTALDEIKKRGFSLVITVDNGIRNKEEVVYAKELGLDIIITDHHVLPEEKDLPDCLVIDPADKSDNYPWPYLAGVGVAFKLVCALLHHSKLDLKQKKLIAERSLDLVAVGTIADLVNLLGENRLLTQKGLKVLNEKRRPGLEALFKIANITSDKPLEAWNVGWQLGPRLNAASRVGHANSAFALINAKDEKEAQELALELNRNNISRQQITEEVMRQVEEQIDKDNLPALIIGVASEGQFWNEGVVGLVSGRICEKYHRPTLVVARIIETADVDLGQGEMVTDKLSFKGSGRSIEGFNLIEAIADCSEHLDKYGGHPMACGFSVSSEEKLEAFKKKISKLAAERLKAEDLIPKLKLDAELDFKDLNLSLAEEVNRLAPYGQNNPQPRLLSLNLRIEDIVFMGSEKQHIKLRLSDAIEMGLAAVWAIDFKVGDKYVELEIGDVIDLAYYLDINDFNGRREVQLKIIDWRPSLTT